MAEDSRNPSPKLVLGVTMPVFLLGLTSFFTDASSEMINAIFPQFVEVVLGGTLVTLGLILGITDAMANLVKGLSGWLSDRLGKRKGLVIAGYGLSNLVAKPLIGIQSNWLPVLLLKGADRLGKGIRTAPRDAMIGYYAGANSGRAFGLHRSMDTLGAVVGPLLAALLLVTTAPFLLTINEQLSFIIIFSLIPGILAFLMTLVVKDVKQPPDAQVPRASETRQPAKKPEVISKRFVRTVAVLASIEFASLNQGFLIARAGDFFDLLWVTLLFAGFNVVYATVSIKGGKLSDKIGRKKLIIGGLLALLFSNVLLAIPWAPSSVESFIIIPGIFGIYGLYSGLVDPTSRAMVSDLSEKKKGKAYGMYYFIVGIVSIPETLLFGFLWDSFGPTIAFTFISIVLAACILVFVLAVPETIKAPSTRGSDLK